MSRFALRSLSPAVGRVSRPFTTFSPRFFPTSPTGAPRAESDTAHISRDKQGSQDKAQPGGSAQGGPSGGGSGGPTEDSGMPDPEVPKDEASKAKQGMTGEDGPARH